MDNKLKQIQESTKERLEKKSDDLYKEKQLKALDDIRLTQLATVKGLADLIKGDTTKEEIIKHIKSINIPDGKDIVESIDNMCLLMKYKEVDFSPLEPLFEKIIVQLENIPKELPETQEAVQLDLSSTNTLLEGLQTAVGALKLDVKVDAPIVKVPQTKLTIEKFDDTKIIEELSKVISAVSNIQIPAQIVEYTDTSLIEEKLDVSNKLLKKIVDKPSGGGGGGGGNGTPYVGDDGFAKHVTLVDGRVPVDIDMATEGIATSSKQDEQIALATTLNALNVTLQKTVLSWDKVHKLLQETRDGISMPVDYDEATNAKRILSAGGSLSTVSTVTTVGTITNQSNIGGFSADMMTENTSFQDWGISTRSLYI